MPRKPVGELRGEESVMHIGNAPPVDAAAGSVGARGRQPGSERRWERVEEQSAPYAKLVVGIR